MKRITEYCEDNPRAYHHFHERHERVERFWDWALLLACTVAIPVLILL